MHVPCQSTNSMRAVKMGKQRGGEKQISKDVAGSPPVGVRFWRPNGRSCVVVVSWFLVDCDWADSNTARPCAKEIDFTEGSRERGSESTSASASLRLPLHGARPRPPQL